MEKTTLTELVKWVLYEEYEGEEPDEAHVRTLVADMRAGYRDDSETSSEMGEFIVTPD